MLMTGRGISKWAALMIVAVMVIAGLGPILGRLAASNRAPGVPETCIFAVSQAVDNNPSDRSQNPPLGLAEEPITEQYFDVPVVSGWNLISFPVVDYGAPATVFDDAGGDTTWDRVMWYDPRDSQDHWKQYYKVWPAAMNQLTNIDFRMGLWVNITNPGSDGKLSVDGEDLSTTQIQLYVGWNMVGYPAKVDTTYTVGNMKSETGATIVEGFSAAATYKTSVLADATIMKKGMGYWVKVPADVTWTVANPESIRQTAEFERMQGVLIRYPLGISYSLIAEMAEDDIVYTIVGSISIRNQAITNYGNNGVNLANCQWIIAASDSYWTRDYGPWWITDENSDFGIVDFPYNRPRPNDDAIPGAVASYLGVPMDYMDVIHTGGNYMTDSLGISVSTDLVLEENPGLTEAEVRQLHQDYLNIDTYHIVVDVNGEYIRHIDCWAKFLDVDKIMIRRVPVSHTQYDEIEAAVDYFESQTSAYGTPYQVYRVYTPNDEPYSNCLILNNKVLLPIMGGSNDAAAIASYQAAMPGYEVIGFTGSWQSTDALHCRANGIPDLGTLYIKHIPVIGPKSAGLPIEIRAKITAYSGSALTAAELCWKLSTEPTYHVVPMTQVIGDHYNAFIPGQASGATVQYYIHASDASGRSETNPLIGTPDPHVFTVA
jgi:agmatine deiminase